MLLTLYLEINNFNYIFSVREDDGQNNFKTIYNLNVRLEGITDNRISDLNKVHDIIKENIYIIEKKLKFTFKEIVIIVDNFNPSYLNFSGNKKLNGSQILRENITYILNTSKSCVSELELKKNILHIFNSKFYLDKKKIDNLPIGLFGDLYSHELSFALIDSSTIKNLDYILDKCNVKIKKIVIKSFLKGAHISNNYQNTDTFFYIQIYDDNSKIFYYENDSLKSEQNFNFGTDIIVRDVSKITSLKLETVKKIFNKIDLSNEKFSDDDYLEKEFFGNENFRKIKKKLVYEVVQARIAEIFEIMLLKNINYTYYTRISRKVFIESNSKYQVKFIDEICRKVLSNNRDLSIDFVDNKTSTNLLSTADKIVHFGWKKEAIPISVPKKSLIAKVFEAIFG